MSPFAKLAGVLAAAALAIAVAGFFLARAWYHDDACSTDEWKCDLGGIGLNLFIYAGASVAVLVAVFGLSAVVSALRRRAARRAPERDF